MRQVKQSIAPERDTLEEVVVPENKKADTSEKKEQEKAIDSLSPLIKETEETFFDPAEEEKEEEKDKELDGKETEEELEKEKASEEKEFKYKSHEEAEKGAKEATRAMHEAKEDAAVSSKKIVDLEKQIGELIDLMGQKEKSSEEKVPGKKKVSSKELRMKQLIQDVESLDIDDEDYNDKYAKLWDSALADKFKEFEENLQEKQKKQVEEEKEKEGIFKDAEAAAQKEGLDMKEGSVDSEMFWGFSHYAPQGKIEDQINWTISRVKEIKTGLVGDEVEKYKESSRKAKEKTKENAILEKGSSGRIVEKEEEDKVTTLGELIEKTKRKL